MKSALFVVHEAGEFVELKRVALELQRRGYRVAFAFASTSYVRLGPDSAWCRRRGIDWYVLGRRVERKQEPDAEELENRRRAQALEEGYVPHSLRQGTGPASSSVRRLAAAIAVAPLGMLELWTKRNYRRRMSESQRERPSSQQRFARQVLDVVRPDVIVFGQEFPGSLNAVITRLARSRGIGTAIIPFAVGTAREMCESLSDNPLHEVKFSLVNRLAAALYPRWVNYFGDKALLRLPGVHVLSLEAHGLAPEHPWLPNNSKVTRILVESPEMERYYRRMQFPDSQLRLTGAAGDDRIASIHQNRVTGRARVCAHLGLDPDKPLLVCAWPTNQYGSRTRPLEFTDYDALCRAWAVTIAGAAKANDWQVVVRPHPVTDRIALGRVLDDYDLRMTDIDTAELVPVCDLFVACVSSTLRWAIACGIPAINYDCYEYGYTDFDAARGVFTVSLLEDFEVVLEDLVGNPETHERAREAQAQCAPEWGLHDGRSMERILQVLDELAAAR